jgi:hypothetical protein
MFRRSSAVEQLTVNQLVVGSIPTVGAKKPHKYQVFMQAPREGSLSCVGWGNIWGNAQLSASKRYWNRYRTADVMCTVRWPMHRHTRQRGSLLSNSSSWLQKLLRQQKICL